MLFENLKITSSLTVARFFMRVWFYGFILCVSLESDHLLHVSTLHVFKKFKRKNIEAFVLKRKDKRTTELIRLKCYYEL